MPLCTCPRGPKAISSQDVVLVSAELVRCRIADTPAGSMLIKVLRFDLHHYLTLGQI